MRHKIYPNARRRIIDMDVLGVINVLHESMNIPNRLKEDLDE